MGKCTKSTMFLKFDRLLRFVLRSFSTFEQFSNAKRNEKTRSITRANYLNILICFKEYMITGERRYSMAVTSNI